MAGNVGEILLALIICSVQVNGEYKYGLQGVVKDYPQRFKDLLPEGIPQSVLDFYVPKDVVSDKCLQDSKMYLQGLQKFQTWAVKMLDSSSKLPSGLLHGNILDLGSYDECLHLRLGSPFQTQFCMLHFPGILPIAKYSQSNLTVVSGGIPLIYPDLMLSLCLPASCDLEDITTHFTNAVQQYNASVYVTKFDCSTKELDTISSLDILDWVAMGYLTIVLFVVIACSLYEGFILYFQPIEDESERSFKSKLIIAFSMISNSRRILSVTDPKRSLSFVNGIRFFSIVWILVSHHFYMNAYFLPKSNLLEVLETIPNIHMAWIISAQLAVDTFFVLSGCLLVYFFLEFNKDKAKVKLNLVYFYLHRYIRYAPETFTVVLLSATLFNYIGDGPLWNHFTIRHKGYCRTNGWTNLLFVNNYVNIGEQCASFTWFLCVDMQLYILSPLVLLPMKKYKNFAYVALPVLIIAAMTNSFFISFINELPAGSLLSRDLQNNATVALQYTKAHIRVAPYLVGMVLGHVLHKTKNRKFKMSKFTVTCGWTLTVAVLLCVIYSGTYFYQDDYVYGKFLASLYTATSRTVWALCLSWVILACETGYGGPVRKFLSWQIFQPLGKLTFTIYMVHTGYQFLMLSTIREPSYHDFYHVSRAIIGEVTVSIFLAFVASLLFETPYRNLEDLILKGSKKKNSTEDHRIEQSTYRHNAAEDKNTVSV